MNGLLILVLLLAPSACSSVPPEPQGFYVQDGIISTTGSGDGYTQLSLSGDKGQLLLVLHGDNVTALLDGEVLPADRVVRDGDKLTVRDVDGDTLYEVRVVDGANSLVYPYDAQAWAVTPEGFVAAQGAWGQGMLGERRKMIGVTTSPVNAALRAQLGLDEEAFVIETVAEGQPAQLGGVEPLDIVVQVDGESASTGRLREALQAKEPGDTLELRVLRQGREHDLTLTVQEPRRAQPWALTDDEGKSLWSQGYQGLLDARAAELNEAHVELAEHLARVESEMQKARAGKYADAERRLAELEAERASLEDRRAQLEADVAQRAGDVALYRAAGGDSRWLMLPSNQPGVSLGVEADRLAKLEERLARLEELLERLAARGGEPAPPAGAPDEP